MKIIVIEIIVINKNYENSDEAYIDFTVTNH